MTATNTPNEDVDVDVDEQDRIIRREQLVAERVKRMAAIEADKERVAEIDSLLLKDLEAGTHTIGDHKVQIRAGSRRLNTTRLAKALPFTQRPELYKAVVDTTAVKHHLSPAELEAYQDQGNPTVVLS